jgi:hypothetical protein
MSADYNEYGQERYDELARQFTTAQGNQGPQGDDAPLVGAVATFGGAYSHSPGIVPPTVTDEITRSTFANGELDPATDSIMVQIWAVSTSADAAVATENVRISWNSTTLFTMPINNVSGYLWTAYLYQFSNSSSIDLLYIDPGNTPLQNARTNQPNYSSTIVSQNWMSKGGSLIFDGVWSGAVGFAPQPTITAVIKVWKVTS